MKILYIEHGPTGVEHPSRCNFQTDGGELELEVAAGASDAIARLEDLESHPYDLAIADVAVPDRECVELIDYVRERRLPVAVIVKARQGDEARVAISLSAGAGGIIKPDGFTAGLTPSNADHQSVSGTNLSELEQLRNQFQQENVYLQQEIKIGRYSGDIVGESRALRRVLDKVEHVAATDTTVLILGETGTGKELIAREIHRASPRRNRPIVTVNCATLPATLIESELFGHEKGAFTGAQARKIGRFELANGGTLVLDEIGELLPELQSKLLRVLQEGEFERLGSVNTIKLNVRVIAATNRDLKRSVQEGLFRADLWYRLSIFPITMPPLRDRLEDIPLLIKHFAIKFSNKFGKRFTAVSPADVTALERYGWPGNVRELASVIERAVIISPGPVLTLADKLNATRESNGPGAERRTLEEIERDSILNRLDVTGWKIDGKGGAAESLGLNPSTLRSRMIKLGIRAPRKQCAPYRS